MQILESNILDEMVLRLVAEFQPEKIILFGSYAWGEPNDDSDIDLFVIVPDSDERPIERMHRAYRCVSGLGMPVDVLVRTRSRVERFRNVYASLECEILERGKVLYG
jgi:predicted nucleotidyltransferase